MNKLIFVLVVFLNLTFYVAAESQSDLLAAKVVKVVYIDDEYEPELIIGLDNGIKLLTKLINGHFIIDQPVVLSLSNDKKTLLLFTVCDDGSLNAQGIFYCTWEDFYAES